MDNQQDLQNYFNRILAKANYFSSTWGREYFKDGSVLSVDVSSDQIVAKVKGARVYTVKFTLKSPNNMSFSCTCLSYNSPCKHVVASIFHILKTFGPKEFSALDPEIKSKYLKIIDIKEDSVTLGMLEGEAENETVDIEYSPDALNKAHASFSNFGIRMKFDGNHVIATKKEFERILNLINSKNSRFQYKGILSNEKKLI